MAETTTSFGDRFHVYPTAGEKLRLSAVELAGLRPESILRLDTKTVAPAGNVTRAEFGAWLKDLRRHGIAADLLPPDELA